MTTKPTTTATPAPQPPTAWCPGQPVSWAYGPLRRLVSATVLRDEGQPWVHLRIRRVDGACVHRKVPRDRVVGVGQGDLFGQTAETTP